MNTRYFVRLANLSKWRCSMSGVNNLLPSANKKLSSLSQAVARNCAYRCVWNQKSIFMLQRNYVHKLPFTLKTVNDRIYLVLNLYDKIDNPKLKPDSHFINDLGLDSLDHIEIITMMEEEFGDTSGTKSLHEYVKNFDGYLEMLKQNDKKSYNILEESIALIDETLENYSPDRWCIAFNGGKDCTALLHLLLCRLTRRSTTAFDTLRAFYFQSGKAFPDIDQFVEDTKQRYNIRIATLHGNVKEASFELKRQNPEIEAVLMGTRKCDLLHFSRQNGLQLDGSAFEMTMKTDADWPPYMRVYPLLKWDYTYVWDFLVNLRVPYCKLYDEGYTSLGDYNNTAKNPALKFLDESGRVVYKPAYELRDGTLERASRISSPKKM